MDISNGPGVRVAIFMQGCTFNCKNCFNPETHDFAGGKEFTEETIQRVLELGSKDFIEGLSILGGEPLHPINFEGTCKLAKAFKEKYPNKTVWVWTGFLFENLANKSGLENIDVIVDGQFDEALHSPMLHWKGSSNQRVIDVKKSLESGKVVELVED